MTKNEINEKINSAYITLKNFELNEKNTKESKKKIIDKDTWILIKTCSSKIKNFLGCNITQNSAENAKFEENETIFPGNKINNYELPDKYFKMTLVNKCNDEISGGNLIKDEGEGICRKLKKFKILE